MTRCMYIYLTYVKYLTGKKTVLCTFSEDYMPFDYSRIRGLTGFHDPLQSKVHRKRLTLLGTYRVALFSMRNSKEALHKPSYEMKTFMIRTLIGQSCRVLLAVTEWGARTDRASY